VTTATSQPDFLERLDELPAIFARYPDVQAVYLFGSVAEGRVTPHSDLDLAVVPCSPRLRAQQLDILADLVEHGFDRVGLVFLDTDDIVLKYEAVRHQRLLYAAPDFDHPSYVSLILRMYWDFLPYLEVQRKALKQRLLHGQ